MLGNRKYQPQSMERLESLGDKRKKINLMHAIWRVAQLKNFTTRCFHLSSLLIDIILNLYKLTISVHKKDFFKNM